VKGLPHSGPWLVDPREDGKVFENDKPSKLKGIGAKSKKRLSKNGITTIKVLRDFSPKKSKAISDAVREVQISNSQLTKFKSLVKHAEPGDPPKKVDYCKFNNLTRRGMHMNGKSGSKQPPNSASMFVSPK
jgi:hypothetical protein